MKKLATAAAAAAALLILTGTPAHAATTGGDVTNSSASDSYVFVKNTAGSGTNVYAGQSTNNLTAYHDKVQSFWLYPGCVARSQYSPAGSYPYQGGLTYAMSQNNLNLSLTVVC